MEFALVAPVFLAALFGSLDGGLLLYSANAVNHATGLGMIVLAQEGSQGTADTDAVAAVKSGGFSSTGFALLDEVDVFMVHVDPTTGAITQDANSCAGSPCYNRYRADGTPIGSVAWAPAQRSSATANLTDLGITVRTHYNYLAFSSATLNIANTRYLRVEPQS
ncbi:MAG: TadE/TadG family type IV pilus assembly protein [Candidatus Dormibacter sp.]